MIQRQTRDTVLLSGWLFADLLLGLVMIFLASINGPNIPPIPPPTLMVTPSVLNSSNCQGVPDNPQCVVTVSETSDSVGSINWSVTSDMTDPTTSNSITYSPPGGTLNHGEKKQVHISTFPCQNGSFTFSGIGPKTGKNNTTQNPSPVTIRWQCTPKHIRLDTNYHRLILQNVDYNGLLTGSQSAINDVSNRIRSQIPSGISIGFAIVYDGAPTDGDIGVADNVDAKVYQILHTLDTFQRSSYYDKDPLYLLGADHTLLEIDLFYFTTQ